MNNMPMRLIEIMDNPISKYSPKNSQENTNCVFELSVLIVYGIYGKSVCEDRQNMNIKIGADCSNLVICSNDVSIHCFYMYINRSTQT